MKRAAFRMLLIGAALGVPACAAPSAGGGPPGAGQNHRLGPITWDEMQRRGQHSSLYVLIQDLRPRWLRSQGPDTFLGRDGQVQVHMDGNRLGGVDILRGLSAHGVTSIQWLPPVAAGARFGLNHSHGAIVISTTVIH